MNSAAQLMDGGGGSGDGCWEAATAMARLRWAMATGGDAMEGKTAA